MQITHRHRKAAQAVWKFAGRIEDAAGAARVSPGSLRRWLAEPDFRTLLAEQAFESLLQAAGGVLQWAPAAVGRLVGDLRGDSPSDARQAAKEILKLVGETQKALAASQDTKGGERADGAIALPADDPLIRQVARLSDDQLARVFAILAEGDEDESIEPNAEEAAKT